MNYKEAIEYINDKAKFGSRLGLDSIGELLNLLGNPQEKLKCIHIGGTNGKGSTSSFISSILMESGYDVGIFTSPYIERFNERIQKNKEDIPDEILANITCEIKEKCNMMVEKGLDHPTTFEIITAIAFIYFRRENVDFVVLEVGLGGRYDSTNIIKNNIATVFSHINMDHIDILGDTLGKIAYQKAGIIKEGSLIVSYPQEEEVESVLKAESVNLNGEFHILKSENIKIKSMDEKGSVFDYKDEFRYIENIKINMLGEHQIYNSSLAIKTLINLEGKGLITLSEENIKKGLLKTKWPARLELLMDKPKFVIDGAHNLDAAKVLSNALDLFEYDKLILGLGILSDKEYGKVVKELVEKADIIVVTEVNMPRKLEAEELGIEVSKYNTNVYIEKDIEKAIKKSLELASDNDLIVFAGSLYLVGEIRTIIKQL